MNHFENYNALKKQTLRVVNILNKINPGKYLWSIDFIHSVNVFIQHVDENLYVIVFRHYDEVDDCVIDYDDDYITFPYEFLYDDELTINKKLKDIINGNFKH